MKDGVLSPVLFLSSIRDVSSATPFHRHTLPCRGGVGSRKLRRTGTSETKSQISTSSFGVLPQQEKKVTNSNLVGVFTIVRTHPRTCSHTDQTQGPGHARPALYHGARHSGPVRHQDLLVDPALLFQRLFCLKSLVIGGNCGGHGQ